MDVPATKSGPHVDERAPERHEVRQAGTLAATTVAPERRTTPPALRGRHLRIAPLATTHQMRPSFAYVDAADEADAPAPRAGVGARRPQAAGRLGQPVTSTLPVARPRELRAAPAGAGGRAVAQARGRQKDEAVGGPNARSWSQPARLVNIAHRHTKRRFQLQRPRKRPPESTTSLRRLSSPTLVEGRERRKRRQDVVFDHHEHV